MPYFPIDGESVYNKLHDPKFHWLVFSDNQIDVQTLKLEEQYADLIDFNAISLTSSVSEIFGTDKPFGLLLRPDNHIAFISTDVFSSELTSYLRKFVGYV